ncbi:unnamed protein product [Orchesella dallaii]|uniref:F-box domain-containing protein n=1 Tax=Orchesella dallaii TaxID=48710 RepID=A0ABP1PV12_9HEXA
MKSLHLKIDRTMSYLIKERVMRDKSDQGDDSVTLADLVLAYEKNLSVKKEGRIEEPASFETRMENVEVAGYHFPADNLTEVWLNIFEKLDAKDKITFSKTCGEWHDWVASKRTSFLFSEVLPVVALTSNLPVKELLNCRTICKSWSRDFNLLYAAHPSHFRLESVIGALENKIWEFNTTDYRMARFKRESYNSVLKNFCFNKYDK